PPLHCGPSHRRLAPLPSSSSSPAPPRPLRPRAFFFNAPAPPELYTFPYTTLFRSSRTRPLPRPAAPARSLRRGARPVRHPHRTRSEEHTSELQSRENLVCRLLLEKKNYQYLTLPQ